MSIYDEFGLKFKQLGNSVTAYLFDIDYELVYLGGRKEVAAKKLEDIFKVRSKHELDSIRSRYTSGHRSTNHLKRLQKELAAKLKY